ncbi:MAG: hypothetical protein ACO1OB_11510, partial [Archangium sp.]
SMDDEVELEMKLAEIFASDERRGRWTDGLIVHNTSVDGNLTTLRGCLWTIEPMRAHPVLLKLRGGALFFAAFGDAENPAGQRGEVDFTPADWLLTWP